MDSVGNFEDDYFENYHDDQSKSSVKAEVQSYIPKQCPPHWYNNTDTCHTTEELCTALKFQADCFYSKGEYRLAIDRYEQVLPLLPKTNVTFQRDCLDGISRSCLKLGSQEGLKWVKKLEDISKTKTQLCVAWSIVSRIHYDEDNYDDAIATLHQLLFYHPLSVSFWMQLVNAYAVRHAISLPHMEEIDTWKTEDRAGYDRNYDVAVCSRVGTSLKSSSEMVEVAQCKVGEIVNCQAAKTTKYCEGTEITNRNKASDIVNHCVEKHCCGHVNPSLCLADHTCQFDVGKQRAIFIIAACLVRLSIVIQATENKEQFLSYMKMQHLLQKVEKQLHQMNLPPDFQSVAKEMLGTDVGWCRDSDNTEFEDLSKLAKEQGEELDTAENSSMQFEKQWFSWVDQFLNR